MVIEGNYVALDKKEWRAAGEFMDEIWFVEVEEAVARGRLVRRHVEAGICRGEEEARERVEGNDLVNGREIGEGRWRVDECVVSREDEGWGPEGQGVEKERKEGSGEEADEGRGKGEDGEWV